MRRIVGVAVAGMLLALIPALASASGAFVCKGTAKKPGVLKGGRYSNGVTVEGLCVVNDGAARVTGTVDVEEGAGLVAGFGGHHSRLTVVGNIVVERGASLLLGCNTTSFVCVNDPAQSNHKVKPTLHSYPRVTGNVTGISPLGIIVHSATIGGSVFQSGGGGGVTCKVPKTGPFGLFHSPVYSTYENSTIYGSMTVTGLKSCWFGLALDNVRNVSLTSNKLADPDAIEILKNEVLGDLSCRGNSRVWDSAETGSKGIWPRKLQRNRVGGKRLGQCRKASAVKKGGGSVGGPF